MAETRKTKYVVLYSVNGADWKIDGPFQRSHSAAGAIRQAVALRVESEVEPAGTYIAVPESSWKPSAITVETQTVIKLNDTPAPT